MPALLKDIYSRHFFDRFTGVMNRTVPGFSREIFLDKIYDSEWESRELKSRMKHIAETLHHFFPADYNETVDLLREVIEELQKSSLSGLSLEFMFFPEYIERYGLDHFQKSAEAVEFITPFTSCEFAVRPFIVKYPEQMMRRMEAWSLHENHHVRRLASEGSRPRLPWAMALPAFKKNPGPVIPILESLKEDPSEYVRRSVANNLNDIAKDNPELVLDICKKWKGASEKTDWIIKHGCRTLLKRANPDALEMFGLARPDQVSVTGLSVDRTRIRIGEKLEFSFNVINTGRDAIKLRIEYAIDYVKANGSRNRKVFKITENRYEGGGKARFSRSQSFKEMTTRKHYPGKHRLAIILNGVETVSENFDLDE